MTKVSFKVSPSLCATRRPSVSAVPPGANGTTTRTGFEGHACGHAAPHDSDAAASTAALMMKRMTPILPDAGG